MAFWFNKKEEPQKANAAQSQATPAQAPMPPAYPVLPTTLTPPAPPAAEEKPLLKPLAKPGAGPALKPLPSTMPAPAPTPAPEPAAGLKVRPKIDQRALYQQLMNGLYDAVFILDERGNVMESNIRVDEVLGYTRDEAWDLPIATIIPGMTRQLFEHLKKNLAENHHVLIDSKCFRKDGSSFAGEIGVCNITFMRGNNMIFTIRNVERRKSALVDAKRLQTAIDHALTPMFVCNTDGTFVTANPLALELFELPNLMDAKTVKFTDLIPIAGNLFADAMKGNCTSETLTMNRQGSTFSFKLALAPIKNGDDIIGVTGSLLSV